MALPRKFRPFVRLVGASTIACSALAFAGQSVAAAAARSAPHTATAPVLSLQNAAAKVKTSNGFSWYLLVDWSGDTGTNTSDLQVSLERLVTSPSGVEIHAWNFTVKQTSLAFNDKTGTLDTFSQASPVLTRLALSFKTTSSKKATCSSGSETIYTGTLSGKVTLVTGLSGGGTVSGALAFNVTPPQIVADSGCVPPLPNLCASETVATSGFVGGPTVALFAGSFHYGTVDENLVSIVETTVLAAPSKATRLDAAAMVDKAGVIYADYTGSSVKIASTGLVVGSGVVSGGKPETKKTTCTYKSTKYDETLHGDSPAKYAGKFSAKMAIGGTLTAPTSTKTGGYEVITVTKA